MSKSDHTPDVDTDESDAPALRRRRKSAPRQADQIDLRDVLEAPVRVKRDGGVQAIDPYEAMLRQNVRKSIAEKCLASMKFVLGEAEKHKIIKEPPASLGGGVFIVPKNLPAEVQRKIFDDPDYLAGKRSSMHSVWEHVLSVVSFERFVECFSGRKERK